jgi:hypothetical protein
MIYTTLENAASLYSSISSLVSLVYPSYPSSPPSGLTSSSTGGSSIPISFLYAIISYFSLNDPIGYAKSIVETI